MSHTLPLFLAHAPTTNPAKNPAICAESLVPLQQRRKKKKTFASAGNPHPHR